MDKFEERNEKLRSDVDQLKQQMTQIQEILQALLKKMMELNKPRGG